MKKHKIILLVEDEETIRTSLAFNLKQSGFQVVTAADGAEGLRRLQKNDIDLVITDLMMEKVGGLQLLREIRKDDQSLPVIILTGYGDLPSAIESLREGADDYLFKPCDLEEILARINHCLAKKQAAQPGIVPRPQVNTLSPDQIHPSVEKPKRKKKEESLRKSKSELKEKERLLEEANIALRLLMKKIAEEKEEQAKQLGQQLHETVLPYVRRLELSQLTEKQQFLLEMIQTQLQHLTAPPSMRNKELYFHLTPMETKIANLVREGESTKEIAALLNLSPRTVETHRKNIRKKAGFHHKNGNLQAILSVS